MLHESGEEKNAEYGLLTLDVVGASTFEFGMLRIMIGFISTADARSGEMSKVLLVK